MINPGPVFLAAASEQKSEQVTMIVGDREVIVRVCTTPGGLSPEMSWDTSSPQIVTSSAELKLQQSKVD